MNRWKAHAHHILDTAERLRRIQARGRVSEDEILYDAALRNLQTLSEATQFLPEEGQALCPDIPWKEIKGFRNILVHNYLGEIDPLTVESVITEHLPALEACVKSILASTGDDDLQS
ncbi:Uncharacterized conserved protein, contains HEPN domain [Thiohalospira halophila DSM 15071]|uniref:Uncharacterized conserved protein, contains HEPN domain n=1 Tax=Thiohalospira halophila DSM 15071 TaxID=1123397 RepID=A0A1I1NKF9_9GAMM|nr:HepT-like ribonuclease domain-containing protein [Thiohalospira halophila]SFC97906.1 Uncharacterized conserved protein, contains HEPN domain [Thiohalospira halophila DSM 15071]